MILKGDGACNTVFDTAAAAGTGVLINCDHLGILLCFWRCLWFTAAMICTAIITHIKCRGNIGKRSYSIAAYSITAYSIRHPCGQCMFR